MLISWSFAPGYWKIIKKKTHTHTKGGRKKKYVMQRDCVIFLVWFRVDWVAMVTRRWQPSVAEKSLAWEEGNVGCVCSLAWEDWTEFCWCWAKASLEMVRDWILCKQCCKPSPSCMQTNSPSCWSPVGLEDREVGESVCCKQEQWPSLDLVALTQPYML